MNSCKLNVVLVFHAFWRLELTWQILIKRLWFWRIFWNLRTTLFHVLDPFTYDFWFFYFMHFEVLSMNFGIFDVFSSLFVHICIVSFQFFFSSTFWTTLFIWFCWCYFIMFCFYFDMNFHFNQVYFVYVWIFTILY